MHQSPSILDLCLTKTRAGKSPDYRDDIVFQEFCKMFSVHKKEKPAFSNSSRLKNVFKKLRFSVNGRPGRRNKTVFSNSSGFKGAVSRRFCCFGSNLC